MSPLDERELDRLRVGLESDRIERKGSASDTSKLRRTICALANDLPGHGLPGVDKAADGAIGGHAAAVQGCYRDFQELAEAVAERAGIEVEFP